MPKKLSKKKQRQKLEEFLAQLAPGARDELESMGSKKVRKRLRRATGRKVKKLRVDGRAVKASCCGKSLAKMCARCPRRLLVELEVA